ncbi:ankyrin [Trametopsis cervina]|nr:ankyrin [Trametopsis cervina]
MSNMSIHTAALNQQVGLVRTLLSQDPNLLNAQDVDSRTALHWAATSGSLDIWLDPVAHRLLTSAGHDDVVRELLGAGADVKKTNDKGLTALAATTGSTGLINVLLHPPEGSPKTRLNPADRVGNTPLHLAMESAHAEAACLLIEAGADRTRENLDGETPEALEGVGGQEQKRARAYVIERCGKP